MNRPALEALRDQVTAQVSSLTAEMAQGDPRPHRMPRDILRTTIRLLDALLAHDALPSSAAVDAYLVRMEGHDRDYVASAAYDRDQKAMWHRMAVDQHLAGLANWSA